MANFVICLDPDAERRSHFVQQIRPLIAPIDHLHTQERHQAKVSVVWAAAPTTPISVAQDAEGLSIIWGEAILPEVSQRATAQALGQAWQVPPGVPYDGFYAASTYQKGHLHVGVDLLGAFPVYYFSHPEGALVASSPELFRYHPCFIPQFNLEGLVGLLVTEAFVGGQCLWTGVHRLGMGNLLTITPDYRVTEVVQYRVPCFGSDGEKAGYHQLTFAAQVEVLATAMARSVARHVPADESITFLMSGGLDSRTLSGFLHRQGSQPTALTYGGRRDIEYLCARHVARQLQFEHVRQEIPPNHPQYCADLMTTWEHLAGGGAAITGIGCAWEVPGSAQGFPHHVISGLMGWALDGTPVKAPVFETLLARRSTSGGALAIAQIKRLLNSNEADDLVDAVVDRLRQQYENGSDLEHQRGWLFFISQDSYRLGLKLWRMSFKAWPRVPVLDQTVLAVSGQLPGATTQRRQAQKALVQQQFPDLAALPLDRNGFDTTPLSPKVNYRRRALLHKLQQRWRQWQSHQGWERRYYYRYFNINSPGVRVVRREANQYRDRLTDIFHQDVLDELLPAMEQLPIEGDLIIATKQCTLLTGILLWAGKNL